MKTQLIKYWLSAAGLMLASTTAWASPLEFAGTPARNAASQISAKYGVSIVFRGMLDPNMPVSFTLTNADADGARLQAVNALANALGADFQKTYVVSAADKDTDVFSPKIDTDADVVFPSLTISAADAVRRIAGVDSAISQYYGSSDSTVTLSAIHLGAMVAAREIAQQTHTRWKVFFAMTPRAQGRIPGGKVIGRTGSGAPIIEEPYVYYHSTPVEAPPVQTASQSAGTTGVQNTGRPSQPYGAMPYGFYSSPDNYPYGFDSYAGNNPYSQNLYPGSGYGYSNSTSVGSGLTVGGGPGFDAPIVFGGGY